MTETLLLTAQLQAQNQMVLADYQLALMDSGVSGAARRYAMGQSGMAAYVMDEIR